MRNQITHLKLGILAACMLLLSEQSLKAQEEEVEFLHNRITLIMGNAHIPSGITPEGDKKWLLLTSWGLDYDYRFNEKWSLSFQTDVVIANFQVEGFKSSPKELFQRTYPVSVAAAGIYSFGEHLSAIVGAGVDMAEEGAIPLLRGGVDYGWEMNQYWGIGVNLIFDYKIEAYDAWTFGVGASRRF